MSPDLRATLYAVAAAALAILSGYGFVTAAQSDQWVTLVKAITDLGFAAAFLVARRHVPARGDTNVPPGGDPTDPTPRD